MLSLFSALCSSLIEPRRYQISRDNGDDWTQIFAQSVDHNGTATFNQRYQVNFTQSLDNKTIFLFIGGESDTLKQRGIDDFSAVLMKHFHAVFFQLEHRYYGESFPTQGGETENLEKYLTVQMAVDDLKNFKDGMTTLYNLPKDAKWVLIGGSYPGLLAAYTRAAYPNDFVAALSSSGVVYASNKYSEFDQQIGISLGETCAAIARDVRRRVDVLLEENPDWLLQQFGMTGLTPVSNFYFVLGELFSLGPQYGARAQLCGPLEDTLTTGADPLMVLAKYSREIFIKNYANGDAVKTYSDGELKKETLPNGPRAWLWQTCKELAYWQIASGRLSIRSPKIDQEYFHSQCKNVFGEMDIPDTDAWNNNWIPLLQKTSHIYYTTGSQDPWTPTCFTELDQIGDDSVAHTIVGSEIGHCSDLKGPKATDSEDLIRTRGDIISHLEKWIAEKQDEL
jgi:pimeloyl-ACP methyl ester carboxylesterase